MSRPRAYTIAAILMLVYSVINVVNTLPDLSKGASAPADEAPAFGVTVLLFTIAVLGIVAAFGVWRLQKWGVVLTIVIAVLNSLNMLPAVIFAPLAYRLLGVLFIVWAVAIIVLLLRPAPRPAAV